MLNYEFPPLGGGAATATFNLLKELAKEEDCFVDLVTSSSGKHTEEQFSQNIRIFYLDIGKNGNVHQQTNRDLLLYAWKSWNFARKLKEKNKYDLVHAFFGIPCGFVAMFLRIPYVVSLRGSDVPFYSEKYRILDKIFFFWLSKIIWKKAVKVVANSEGLRQLALKTAPKQEIEVIYNGVDVETFRPVEKKEKNFVVVSTSRIIKRKGVDFLLDAFVEFSKGKDAVKLVLAGEGEMKKKLEEKANRSDCTEKIAFIGVVERSKMPQCYQGADVFVLPSLNEGMSNSLLEAMGSGLAVIATDTGGTNELVDFKNGLIIEKSSADSIKKALDRLYENKKELDSMKIESRKKAEAMSWKNMASAYLKNYAQLAKMKKDKSKNRCAESTEL